MNNFKGTLEPVIIEPLDGLKSGYVTAHNDLPYCVRTFEEQQANAQLFTDALKVMRETGLNPSELVEQHQIIKNQYFILNETYDLENIENNQLREENAILKRRIEDMEHNRFERMDKYDAISGGRSLSEVCEENAKLKEALKDCCTRFPKLALEYKNLLTE